MLEKQELQELINLGLSSRQIADRFGKSQTSIRYWLTKYNLALAPAKGGRQKLLPEKACLNCAKVLQTSDHRAKYCSPACSAQFQQKLYIENWLNGRVNGQISGGTLISGHIRSYLLGKADYKCSECAWSKVNPFTNKIPLEINHIDGNFLNNTPGNLEVLCPNCHALKHTYENRGIGRRAKGYMK
jgi:hypothetical protein